MTRLLVPFDDSPSAHRALEFAVDMARRLGGTDVHVVTAHDNLIDVTRETAYQPLDKLLAEQEAHSRKVLQPALDKGKAAGVAMTTAVLSGSISQSIVEYARANACTQIVMGTHGRGTIGTLLLGSIAQKVVHLATVPVTLVK
jgi:nucleotide-binding universal stress UspA family protein